VTREAPNSNDGDSRREEKGVSHEAKDIDRPQRCGCAGSWT